MTASTRTPETFTEITLTGTPNEVEYLIHLARESRLLVWASAPRYVSAADQRLTVSMRLTPTL
jgi:hypothetical protein